MSVQSTSIHWKIRDLKDFIGFNEAFLRSTIVGTKKKKELRKSIKHERRKLEKLLAERGSSNGKKRHR